MSEENNLIIESAGSSDRELGVKPIVPLFLKYTWMTFVGTIAQGIMVILEGIIIGNGLGADGLTVVGLIMPLEYLNLALGGFFAIGISTLAATYLGDGKTEEAREAHAHGMWFTILFMIILSILLFIFASPVANFLGTPTEYMDMVVKFIRIFACWYPFCCWGQVATYMARVDEKPGIGMWAMTGSAVAAVIYLWLSTYVFHFGPVGTAHYYGCSIGLWALACLYFLLNKDTLFKMHLSDLKKLNFKKYILPMMKIGFPFLLVQISNTVFTTIVNNFLGSYGSALDIAAYAIVNGYFIYILMMVTQAAGNGLMPIASYNMGAKFFGRVSKLLKVSIIFNIAAVAALVIITEIFTTPMTAIFVGYGDVEFLAVCVRAVRIVIILSCLGFCANLIANYFQAVESVVKATVLGVCRYILFATPMMAVLSRSMGGDGVWYAQPTADACAFLLTMLLVVMELKRLKKLDNERSN